MSRFEIGRRDFLRWTSVGAAATVCPGVSALAPPSIPVGSIVDPGQKLRVACVGVGGKGRSDVSGVSGEDIVALCDVDLNRAMDAFNQYPKATHYKDYRKMLVEMGNTIDAVTISTPDHMHFPIAMMAIEMGKHVFVQKPLSHSIWEARQMLRAARKHDVITQMGNQGHANEGTRLVYEWVRSGAIGPVHEVNLYTNRPVWPQGVDTPTECHDVPDSLDWNLWLGVAPDRRYNVDAYHPFKWRGWWDFGCGALGDMGCHIMDASFWALGLEAPEWVEAESDARDADTTPTWSIVTYQFPARGNMPPVTVKWYDGNRQPPPPACLEKGRTIPNDNGQLIIGEKAAIMADTYCNGARIVPEVMMREIGKPEKMVERVKGGHYKEWIQACKGGPLPGSNFEHAVPLTEMVLLGNLAIRTGKRIEWDSRRLICTNVPEANDLVRRPYRVF